MVQLVETTEASTTIKAKQSPKMAKNKTPLKTKEMSALKGTSKSSPKSTPKMKSKTPMKGIPKTPKSGKKSQNRTALTPKQKKQAIPVKVQEVEEEDEEVEDMKSEVDDDEDDQEECEESEDGEDEEMESAEEAEETQTKSEMPKDKQEKPDMRELSYKNTIFITKLNHKTSSVTLKAHFDKFGTVTSITLPWNKKKNANKGFGFVAFASSKDLATTLAGVHELEGKTLFVKESTKQAAGGKREREENGGDEPSPKKLRVKATANVQAAGGKREHEENGGDEPSPKKLRVKATANVEEPEKREPPSNKNEIFIAKLNNKTSCVTLKAHFDKFGIVTSIRLPWSRVQNTNRGFGFVAFASSKDMATALAGQHELEGETLCVEESKASVGKREREENGGDEPSPKKLRVKATANVEKPDMREPPSNKNEICIANLNNNTSKVTLKAHFDKFGTVTSVTLPWDIVKNTNKRFGFVAFASPKDLATALAGVHELEGKTLAVRDSKPSVGKREREENGGDEPSPKKLRVKATANVEEPDKREPPSNKNEIFIAKLNSKTSSVTLKAHFGKFGTVTSVTLPCYKNTNKGFGFVAFASSKDMATALAGQHELEGKTLFVKESKNNKGEKEAKPDKIEKEEKKVVVKDSVDDDEDMEGDDDDSAGEGVCTDSEEEEEEDDDDDDDDE